MEIQRIYTQNSLRNYDYIITTSCSKVIVVDPSTSSLVDQLDGLERIDYYFITHEHFDHVVGLKKLFDRFGGKVVAHRGLSGKLALPVHLPVDGGDAIEFERESFNIVFIPGHIMTHIGFISSSAEGRETAAFFGDTVFNGGVGNTHSGDVSALYHTIKDKVQLLDGATTLYPEHDYWETNLRFTLSIDRENKTAKRLLRQYREGNYLSSGNFPASTMASEREYNLFLRTHLPHIQEEVRKVGGLEANCSEREVFIALRRMRDQW